MALRNRNTNTGGGGFDFETRAAVWIKAAIIPGYAPAEWRRDGCGAPIRWVDYGRIEKFGWEIDHIKPVAAGGSDVLSNLQALQWANNRAKSDNPPDRWACEVRF
ncbi:MAG: HNH endonuclease signature motif containing protein [Archangium sp.]|nr:HNH endonuclease signature motif containing protein [Archangium sp.]MDP3573861.1 HNH endonuclease signature motif containing protein [Archangium sp.]